MTDFNPQKPGLSSTKPLLGIGSATTNDIADMSREILSAERPRCPLLLVAALSRRTRRGIPDRTGKQAVHQSFGSESVNATTVRGA